MTHLSIWDALCKSVRNIGFHKYQVLITKYYWSTAATFKKLILKTVEFLLLNNFHFYFPFSFRQFFKPASTRQQNFLNQNRQIYVLALELPVM